MNQRHPQSRHTPRSVSIIAVHRAFVLGLGARHRGIHVELSEDRYCDSVFAFFTYLLTYLLINGITVPLTPTFPGKRRSA